MTVRRGLVLGVGGVLGAAWTIGALSALEQVAGVDPREAEVLVGTSAGSVLATFIGAGVPTATLVNHQRGIVAAGDPDIAYDYDRDSGGSLPPRPRLRLGSTGLLRTTARHPRRVTPLAALSALLPQGRGSLAAISGLVQAVLPDGGWVQHPATWVVAMDYETGRRTTFGRARAPLATMADAVTASCAIPGWYSPVTIGGRRYVDGGACSPTSLDLLAGLGLDVVHVLSPMTSLELDSPATLGAKLERYLRRLVTRRLLREAARVQAAGTRVVLVCPGPTDLRVIGGNLMDPRRREAVFETSLRTSAATLARAGTFRHGLAEAG